MSYQGLDKYASLFYMFLKCVYDSRIVSFNYLFYSITYTLRQAKWPLQSEVTCSDRVLLFYICCNNRFPLITIVNNSNETTSGSVLKISEANISTHGVNWTWNQQTTNESWNKNKSWCSLLAKSETWNLK